MNRRQKLVQQQFLNNEEAVLGRLQYIYDRALFDINDKIRNLEFSIGDLQEEYDWMDDDDPKKEVIRSRIQSKIYQKQYQEQLQQQVGAVLNEMQTQQFTSVAEYLDTCYTDGFVGSQFDLHGQGVPFAVPLDQESMVRAVQLNSKIRQELYTRLGEDVGILKNRISAEVSRGIATGASYAQTAKQLANQTRIGYNRAARIARTEGHRIQTTATDDAAHAARDRGADLLKQWDATLDGKTRESHIAVDRQIRELDETFSNGLKYPGDPAGGAAEVVNCRCAYLQRARWALKEGMDPDTGEVTYTDDAFTKWNNFSGQLESFDSPESYDDFKQGFFSQENREYMNYVQQLESKYHTKNFETVLARMTDREYAHYSKLLANNPLYNKGVKANVPTPAVDLPSLRSELKTVKLDMETKKRELTTAKRDLYYSYNKAPAQARVDALQAEVDALTAQFNERGKLLVENLNTTFKVPTDNKDFISMIVDLDLQTEYRECTPLASKRSFADIISNLAGGDNTQGSCASVGFGYIGQKNGWDCLDFRDGVSRDWFGSKVNKVNIWKALNVPYITEDSGKANLTNAKRILGKMEKGKEYYLSVGGHAAIVRKNDAGIYQYLELQSATNNGWMDFGNLDSTFKYRFGCTSSSRYYSTAYLTDIDGVADSAEFRTILGYLNTSESMQRKGSSGRIR